MKLLWGVALSMLASKAVWSNPPSLKDTYMALQASAYAISFLARHAPVYWENPETGYAGSSVILSGHRDQGRVLMRTCVKEPTDKSASDVDCQEYYMISSARGWVAEHDPVASIGMEAKADADQVYRATCYRVEYRLNVPIQKPFTYNGTICKADREKWKVMP